MSRVNEIKETIKTLESVDVNNLSVEEIKDLLFPMFKGLIVQTPKLGSGIKLFRSRKGNKPGNIKSILYPPSNKVTNFGRVNRPSQSVFYSATSREATFFEQDLKVGDFITIGRWKTTSELLVANVGYSSGVFNGLNSNRECQKWGDDTKISNEENRYILNWLSKQFATKVKSSNESYYKISVAIAEKFLMGELFSGIIYPTIAMRANADNVVLYPEVVDEHLSFERVEYAEIEEVGDFKFEIKVRDFADELTDAGKIKWKGRHPNWKLKPKEKLELSIENGKWVARDNNGNIVEPK